VCDLSANLSVLSRMDTDRSAEDRSENSPPLSSCLSFPFAAAMVSAISLLWSFFRLQESLLTIWYVSGIFVDILVRVLILKKGVFFYGSQTEKR
jgi:hypothetical protein